MINCVHVHAQEATENDYKKIEEQVFVNFEKKYPR